MKKTVSLVLVCVLLACTLLTLVSCDSLLIGKYSADLVISRVTYEFTVFGKVIKTVDPILGDNTVEEGEYKFNKDGTEITLTFGEKSSTCKFSSGIEDDVKYIKLDGIKFTKVE